MADAVLPDSEAVAIAFFKAHSLLSAFSGACVGTQIQPDWTGFALRISRVAGTPFVRQVDSPRLQLDCWSATSDLGGVAAADFALHVAATIPDFAGLQSGVWISGADIADGPVAEASDDGRPRYRIDLTFDIANT